MLAEYYHNRDVKDRLLEFLGGTTCSNVTAEFITADDCSPGTQYTPRPVGELWKCLDLGLDIGRSLWDQKSLLAHLDIEYVNFDFLAEPYLEPHRSFELQAPVSRSIQDRLLHQGIVPLHLLSGRGHHFVWQIARSSSAFTRLSSIGYVPRTLADRYASPQAPNGKTVEPELGAAFAGLGLILEFVAHQILNASTGESQIPIELTAVKVGTGKHGREIVSIDLSEYGDPLHTRGIRMPFSGYLKPEQQRSAIGEVVDQLPPLFMIPLHDMNIRKALSVMRDTKQVIELARRASVQIPEQSQGTESLIDRYQESRLCMFHRQYYSEEHDSPEMWTATYDRTPMSLIPPCVRRILEQPNDTLLKPAGIQHVVRAFLTLGWHPRHIAGLIRSKYERNYGWGDYWYRYDAASRADFYTRLFSGLFETGHDDLVDFNCRSTQEKGYCTAAECDINLTDFQASLLTKRDEYMRSNLSRTASTTSHVQEGLL